MNEFLSTIELKDSGHYGLLLPPEQMLPASEESWAFNKAMTDIMIERYGNK